MMARKKVVIALIVMGIAYVGVTGIFDLTPIIMPDVRLIDYNVTGPVFLGVELNRVTDYHIYMYDISNGKISTLVSNKEGLFSPAIDGDNVAYISYSGGNPDIHVINIPTKEIKHLTSDPYQQDYPHIHENRVVWEDERSKYAEGSRVTNTLDVYMYDLNTDEEKPIITTQGKERFPSIYGDIVVCEVYSDLACEKIYFYDLSTGELTEIASNSLVMGPPHVYKNTVVWASLVEGDEILTYDITTGKTRQITSSAENEMDTDIYEDKVVYAKGFLASDLDIYIYDIESGLEDRITNTPNNLERLPRVYQDKIVYIRWVGDYTYVYLYDLKTGEESMIESPSKFNYLVDIWENRIVWMGFDVSEEKEDSL